MMAAFTAIGVLLILMLEGAVVTHRLLRVPSIALTMALALPCAAILSTFVVALLTITHLPLSPLPIFLGHVGMTAIAELIARFTVIPPITVIHRRGLQMPGILRIACIIILAISLLFSAVHAIVLPTVAIDNLTNWTMRSKVSFVDRQLAFDRTEERGIAKPQYPFLIHALQITANQGQREWSDHAANTALWLLVISLWSVCGALLKAMRGTDIALGTMALIVGMPLVAIQTGVGYPDVPLMSWTLLAALVLTSALESRSITGLMLSGGTIAGALWTKSEGIVLAAIPWSILLSVAVLRKHARWQHALVAAGSALLLFLPFLLVLIGQGLSPLPHDTDLALGCRMDALPALITSLFCGGSFGALVLPILFAIGLLAVRTIREKRSVQWTEILLLVWGAICVGGVLFTYMCTPNVSYLLNGQSFFRQMLTPLSLFVAGIAWAWP